MSVTCDRSVVFSGSFSSTNKSEIYIAEILLKVALNTINLNLNLYKHLIFMLPEIFCGVHKVATLYVRPSVWSEWFPDDNLIYLRPTSFYFAELIWLRNTFQIHFIDKLLRDVSSICSYCNSLANFIVQLYVPVTIHIQTLSHKVVKHICSCHNSLANYHIRL